jgi:hypothetical protein
MTGCDEIKNVPKEGRGGGVLYIPKDPDQAVSLMHDNDKTLETRREPRKLCTSAMPPLLAVSLNHYPD